MAQPGDTVLVYNGVYREPVIFPKGGTDDSSRITLKANPGDTVLITGSEPVEPEEWSKDKEKVYKMTKDNTYFGDFNPFAEKWGAKSEDYPDFFSCGSVYLNDTVLEQVFEQQDVYTKDLSWYAVTDDKITTIWANFGGEDPAGEKNSTEINKRKQCISAVWNQGYITIDGLSVSRGCGPKTTNFAQYGSKPMEGAIGTNGGHNWIIENCEVYQNRGVAIDYGLGSRGHQENNGGEPAMYGHHIIRNCNVYDNATNGIMAYRGAYSEIYGCSLSNNNALNTGLLSEAYVKNVNSGFGINVHDNYFYSDQEWDTIPVWYDCELDGAQINNNVFYSAGPDGHGLSQLYWEQSGGWSMCANNIFVDTGILNVNSSNLYIVNNLFLDNHKRNAYPAMLDVFTSYGYNGYSRVMRAVEPGTLTPISIKGTGGNSHYETFSRFNKLYNNIFFGTGLSSSPELDEVSEEDYIGSFYEFENIGSPEEEKDIWKPLDENYQPNSTFCYGNECDYNVYYAGADKINHQYGAGRGYEADANSIKAEGDYSYKITGDKNSCTLTLNVDNSAREIKAPAMTSSFFGNPALYEMLGYEFPTPDVDKDFFGGKRDAGNTVASPFADLKAGENVYKLWPTK